jgi:hypothetical protein
MQISAGMNQSEIIEVIAKSNPKARLLTGFDEAIVGLGRTAGGEVIAIYDRDRILSLLVRGGMSPLEGEEFVSFNLELAYAGPDAPVIARLCIP